jgi:predicted PhzF superfamily epimerase YddE/YHI9
MSSRLRLWIVDAFASRAFSGNQAAVVAVDRPLSDEVRQRIAKELNLSEVAYIEPCDAHGSSIAAAAAATPQAAASAFATASRFVLRWFTPTVEVPLCGHATLAAAHVLVSELGNRSPEIVFRTVRGAGDLTVRRHDGGNGNSSSGDSENTMLEMSLPLAETRGDPLPPAIAGPAGRMFVEALGLVCASGKEGGGGGRGGSGAAASLVVNADHRGDPDLRFVARDELNYLLVPARSSSKSACAARLLRELPLPDPGRLKALCPQGLAGVIVAVKGGEKEEEAEPGSSGGGGGGNNDQKRRVYRCTSRFFAPWMGIDEDSVTGSAHTVLGPWFDLEGPEEGEEEEEEGGRGAWWWARQASPRGGDVRVRVAFSARRVYVAGESVVVVRGEMDVPAESPRTEQKERERGQADRGLKSL